jgi:PTH1 family peptidyl-tRNA hydrolase
MSKFLIVGLGNIGAEYANTRHNIGFKVVDEIAQNASAKFKTDRLADMCEIKHRGKIFVLIKPSCP